MGQPEIGAGNVVVMLGEHEVTLRPSLKAAITLSNQRGGITAMVQRCLDFEFDAIHTVVLAGLGGENSKDLPELVYSAGLINLSAICIKFLHIVANGGRPLGDDDEDGEGEEKAPLENSSQ